MLQHDVGPRGGYGGQHLGVGKAARHVVHDARARGDGGDGGRGVHRVDADDRAGRGEGCDDRQHPLLLDGGVDGRRAGPCRLAADVEHRGARRVQGQAVRDRRVGVEVAAAITERVRRDVDDPHDDGHLSRRFRRSR